LVTIWDSEYKATKLIKQGRTELRSPFWELADWIASEWEVIVLNVIYDRPAVPRSHPRLQVILESADDLQKFKEGYDFDSRKKRAIAERFAQLVEEQDYGLDGLFVVFSAFAPSALQEADSRITRSELRDLRRRLGDRHLWKIHRNWGRATFMFDTEAHRYALADRKKCEDLYFELLQRHDEFGYLERSRFSVDFDSKENFVKNYGRNWFAYDR
jgi:hypothetical protein